MATRATTSWAALFLLVFGGYALGSELAFSWFGADDTNASFFPAAGVTLAALVLVPRRRWPVVLLAAAMAEFALDLRHDLSVPASAGYVVANVAQPLVGALLLRAVTRDVDLGRTRDVVAFLGCAAIAGPAVGGALGATSFVLVDGGSGWARFAGEWLVGDGLGVLVIGGAILSLRATAHRPLTEWRVVEALVLASACISSTIVVFRLEWFAFVYLPIALLVVLAFRAGTRGVALTSAAMAIVAAEATADGHTFWEVLAIDRSTALLYLQLALGVVIACTLALAAEIAERERNATALARSETERLAAIERAELFEAEREARLRAELLERNAAHIAAASTVEQIAASTVTDLEPIGVSAAGVRMVRGEEVELLAAVGIPEDEVAGFRVRHVNDDHTPAGDALRRDQVVELESAEELESRYPGSVELRRRLGAETVLVVPFHAADGRVLGTLSVTSRQKNWLDDGRRQLVAALAEQTGLALERARLREEADAAAEGATWLASLGESLERVTSVKERAERLVEALVGAGCGIATVHVLSDADEPELVARAASPEGGKSVDDDLAELVAAVTSDGEPARSSSLLSLPLRARGHTLGVLTIGALPGDEPRLLVGSLRDVALRAAISLDNALLYERERSVSHSLQLGLLRVEPDAEENVQVAAAYRPGTATLEVGGDWYDRFVLPNDRLALVVGDVVGHGLDAAVAMSQLRGAVRALAPLGTPSELLDGIDRFVDTLPDADMATLAFVELDQQTGDLRYACAGHPPPLVVSRDGATRFLWDGRSAPLGSRLGEERTYAKDRVDLDDTLVLYTDGLVERRTESLADGLARLVAAAREEARTSPRNLVEHLLDRLLEGKPHDDDVCLLVLRPAAAGREFARSFPAAPHEVRSFRHALTTWLERLGVNSDARRDFVLAAAEAAANSAEHAYAFDGTGVVQVSAEFADDGGLQVEVRDDGRWRDPEADSDRGHGTRIMRALMDEVAIEPGARGTVVRMRLHTTSPVAT